MQNFFIGFVSASLAFLVSSDPRLCGFCHGAAVKVVSIWCVFGAMIGLCSTINGYDVRMFLKSKVDYAVNVFISVVIGLFLGLSILYCLGADLVGRRAYSWMVLFYVSISFFVQAIIANRGKKIYLYGLGVDRFRVVIKDIGASCVSSFYEIDDKVVLDEDLDDILSRLKRGWGGYIVPSADVRDIIRDYVSKNDSSLSEFVSTIDEVFENELGVVNLNSFQNLYWWQISSRLRANYYARSKRFFDLFFVVVILILSLPIFSISALIIWLQGDGPVIYRQTRVGYMGKCFTIYKLRTMSVDSEVNGAQWAQRNDARVTMFGKILRKTRIDELPQLWNILVGDMSLIGPRPERPEFVSLISKDVPAFGLRLVCKPGLTGWAQVNYRYGASLEDSVTKLSYDLFYIKNACLILDFRILTRTVVSMVRGAR